MKENTIYYDSKMIVKRKTLEVGTSKITFETYITVIDGEITLEKYEGGELIETINLAKLKN